VDVYFHQMDLSHPAQFSPTKMNKLD